MEIEDVSGVVEIEGKEVDEKKGRRPDFRVVQPVTDANGEKKLKSVGGLWRNTSRNGNVFYTLRIGSLSLLVFPNESA
ncbi:MAG: hypothetical protein QXH27_02530 [Candidatus Micrarchaeia archaeon]